MKNNRLIIIEGVDNVGKSTLCKYIKEKFKDKCIWVNAPEKDVTETFTKYNNILLKYLRGCLHIAATHEILSYSEIDLGDGYFLLLDRSHLSKQMYDQDIDIIHETKVMHDLLNDKFDLSVFCLVNDNKTVSVVNDNYKENILKYSNTQIIKVSKDFSNFKTYLNTILKSIQHGK